MALAENVLSSTGRVRRSAVNVNTSGDNTIFTAVPGKFIRVVKYKLVVSGANTLTWESGGGTVLDGPCAFGANGGESTGAWDEHGHFETKMGENLILNLSASVQVGGHIVVVDLPLSSSNAW